MTNKNWISLFLYLGLSLPAGLADSVKDTLEVRLNIEPRFQLTLDTFMVPRDVTYNEVDLVRPSQNTIEPGLDLEGQINLGFLIARKGEGSEILPLISEYKVLLRVHCETNHNSGYQLTQTLLGPLTGEFTGTLFPATAFVCMARINPELGVATGEILIPEETPVSTEEGRVIYRSGEPENINLSNVIDIFYWVSDAQEDKVLITQRADTYRSSIVITMAEL